MNRYILKFKKTGQLRYTSHLDLMRLFRRNFKRAGIDLLYSQGFNPQPKMSFAQALSLGHESIGEYLEIETQRSCLPDMIMGLVNSHMPFGIEVIDCKELDSRIDKIAAIVEYADYKAVLDPSIQFSNENIIEEFLSQDNIFIEKWVKKKRKEISTDIKALIEDLRLELAGHRSGDGEPAGPGHNPTIYMTLSAGSRANLNPELLLEALFKFDNLTVSKGDYRISRLEIFDINKKPLI